MTAPSTTPWISAYSVVAIALYVALYVHAGAWPFVVTGAFATLVVVCGVAWAKWDGKP